MGSIGEVWSCTWKRPLLVPVAEVALWVARDRRALTTVGDGRGNAASASSAPAPTRARVGAVAQLDVDGAGGRCLRGSVTPMFFCSRLPEKATVREAPAHEGATRDLRGCHRA